MEEDGGWRREDGGGRMEDGITVECSIVNNNSKVFNCLDISSKEECLLGFP